MPDNSLSQILPTLGSDDPSPDFVSSCRQELIDEVKAGAGIHASTTPEAVPLSSESAPKGPNRATKWLIGGLAAAAVLIVVLIAAVNDNDNGATVTTTELAPEVTIELTILDTPDSSGIASRSGGGECIMGDVELAADVDLREVGPPAYTVRDEQGTVRATGTILGIPQNDPDPPQGGILRQYAFGLTRPNPAGDGDNCEINGTITVTGGAATDYFDITLTAGGHEIVEQIRADADNVTIVIP